MNITMTCANQTLRILFLFASMLLVACGSSNTEENPNTAAPQNEAYSGPAPATTDVQNFKLAVWDNLVSVNRCGACHSGDQSPNFVDNSDVNVAYAQANTIIDLDDPESSTIVTKVAGGHNCWEASDSACASIITSYIENWAGDSAGSTKQIVLRAPELRDPGATKTFPEDSADYSSTVYPLLTTYCSSCHVEGLQTPFLASSDVDISYAAAQSRMDLLTPAGSRLVTRLRSEFHNCWGGNCTTSSQEMEDAIAAFSDTISTAEIDEDLVTSKALSLTLDGLVANSGGRYEDNVIALYEFKTGEGLTAYDTSGIEPALNLSLSGNVDWVDGWGIRIGPAYTDEETSISYANGKAQGSTATSVKLYNQITATGEYSIEAWVVPGNVSQEDARIITYSGSSTVRNFALGQTLYNYDFLHRSTTTDQNDAFSTDDDDERLQATLQHVVVTYSPGERRKIYVNGVHTGDMDGDEGGLLNGWDNSFAFVLGNETDGNSLWQGRLRMVAIHNRALTDEQISQNYGVGVGEKFYLLFGVSDLVDMDDSFIVFEASQFDSYSYLFNSPFFVSLNDDATPDNIPLSGMKLGINGKEAVAGQAFRSVSTTLNETDYVPGEGQVLSNLGTIIALEQGPDNDEFFLSFEQIGTFENARTEGALGPLPEPADKDPASDIGLKTFDEINVSMSVMTGVDKTEENVANTYTTIRQQLPTIETINGFLPAHQMAITQLAIQYCNALVEDTSLRGTYFSGFDFDEDYSTAFDVDGRNAIINPLLANVVGSNIASQPESATIDTELNNLIDQLTTCDGGCGAGRTATVVKATCAAALGSAIMLVQ